MASCEGNTIIGHSTITGLEPVLRQAVQQVSGGLSAEQLGVSREQLDQLAAQQITSLNDWEQLTRETKDALIEQTGINLDRMPADEREATISQLLHSPLPFGDLTEPLRPNERIDLGFTHILDKSKTTAEDLGNGQFKITLISDNNNGSHMGHRMGSFVIQLGRFADTETARQIGNNMVTNTNDNNQLYLEPAARAVMDDVIAEGPIRPRFPPFGFNPFAQFAGGRFGAFGG